LRNAAVLRALSDGLLLALPSGVVPSQFSEDLSSLFWNVGVTLLVGTLVIVAGIASWVLRILGWGNLCRARVRRFYCITRIVVIVAPIAGIAIIVAGVVLLLVQALSAAAPLPTYSVEGGVVSTVLVGLVVLAASDIFEAIASFDLGHMLNTKLLMAASLAFLASTMLGMASSRALQPTQVRQVASLAVLALLAAGYHLARGAAPSLPTSRSGEQG